MIAEVISKIIDNTINSFDFPFCVTVNIATYIVIRLLSEGRKKCYISTWNKRLIFVAVSIIASIVYYVSGSEVKVIFNSIILAPVSWSWIFKPICAKLNIDYSSKVID